MKGVTATEPVPASVDPVTAMSTLIMENHALRVQNQMLIARVLHLGVRVTALEAKTVEFYRDAPQPPTGTGMDPERFTELATPGNPTEHPVNT